jgi:rSAM/selenodomain-associated transferase 2
VLQKQKWLHEVIVADGGSVDGTREWLNAQNFARVVDAPVGKGNQINAGVQAATGDVLLFLHADCQLPPDGLQHIASALTLPEIAGGCFEVSFTSNHAISLKLVAKGINFRTWLSHSATGDQGIFVRKQVFDQAGGCPNWPLFEDVELVRRIKTMGKFAVLRSRLRVSPRRHLHRGVFRTVLLVYMLRVAFWFGASPFTLKRWFDDFRPDTQKIPDGQPTAERPS